METNTQPINIAGAQHTQNIDKLAMALRLFQNNMGVIGLDSTAKFKTKSGATVSYKYASLATIVKATKQPLEDQGLSVLHLSVGNGVAAMLLHTSGQYIMGAPLTVPYNNSDPKSLGSAVTYARRYTLAAILGLVTDEDDDAGAAAEAKPQGKPKMIKAAYDKAVERIREGDKSVLVKCQAHFSLTEKQSEELTNLAMQYADA